MATEEKKLYGFGVNDTSLFGETFETVDELIELAQTEYDNENSDYDDEDTNRTPFVLHYLHELQNALRLRGIEKEIIAY